jgi:DNA transformation protein
MSRFITTDVKRSRKTPGPGPLQSLRVSDGFRTYALDQLSSVERLKARPMFGGFGLYAGDLFFGILAADVLYLKVDETNRGDYEKAKSRPFRPFGTRPMSLSYYAVPVSVLEAAPILATWVQRSIAVARTKKKS